MLTFSIFLLPFTTHEYTNLFLKHQILPKLDDFYYNDLLQILPIYGVINNQPIYWAYLLQIRPIYGLIVNHPKKSYSEFHSSNVLSERKAYRYERGIAQFEKFIAEI